LYNPFFHLHGYVKKIDELIEILTIYEMIYHLSLLQLPEITSHKKTDILQDTILEMSLEDYADTCIGGKCYRRGLERGERTRISIERELLKIPYLMFIDEPLYHIER